MREFLKDDYDVIVCGGGPVGLATAYRCAKAGKKVLCLEKSVFFNGGGSSGDVVRMLRTMYTEDYMADLAHETLGLWKELGDDAGEGDLVWMTGLLNFGDPNYGLGGPEGTLLGPIPNLERLGMQYKVLTAQEIMEEYPFRNIPSNHQGVFAPDNGVINLPLVLRSLYKLCLQYGCKMVSHAEVKLIKNLSTTMVEIEVEHTDVDQKTKQSFKVKSKKAAITSNSFCNHIIKPSFGWELDMTIWEMTSSYFVAKPGPNATVFKSMWFNFQNDTDNDPTKSNLYYGFPAVPWMTDNHCRIALDAALRQIKDPNDRHDGVETHDVNRTRDWVREHIPGVDDTPLFNVSALMANVYDNMFVLDFIPETNNNVVMFACGWAMKFIPLLGKILSQLLDEGKTQYPIDHFALNRGNGALIIKEGQTTNSVNCQVRAPRYTSMHCKPLTIAKSTVPTNQSSNPDGASSSAPTQSLRSLFASRLLQRSVGMEAKFHSIIAKNRSKRSTKASQKDLTVGIIGAGMAGLYAAMILQDLGLQYNILEANKERVGGRIYTYRFPQNQDKYQTVELGAMRFPKIEIMDRLLNLDKPWSLFSKLEKAGHKIPTIPYHLTVDNNLVYYNGKRIFANTLLNDDPLYFSDTHNGGPGTAVPDKYTYQPYGDLLDAVYKKFSDDLENDFESGFETLLKSDNYSTRAYLFEKGPYPQSVVNYLETMDTGTGLYDMAFSETIMDYFDFSAGDEWLCIDGGTDIIVNSMVKTLRPGCIEQGKIVTKVSRVVGKKGDVSNLKVDFLDGTEGRLFKHVISTGTLASLRRVDLSDLKLSHNKRTAIRSLHYDHSVKIALSFKSRWWEDSKFMNGKPMLGGKSSTDLPVRTIVYPSYGIGQPGVSGVLIVSYTWSLDASRIGSLVGDRPSEEVLIKLCMANLAEVHNVPVATLQQLFVDYKCWDWYNDDYSSGAFALYSPSQFTQLFPSLTKPSPDGRFHLAGEATSVHHGWIIGSLNSAYRSVDHILQVEGLDELRAKLRLNWGFIDEVEDPQDDQQYVDPHHNLSGPNAKKFRSNVSQVAIQPRFKAPRNFKPRNTAASVGGLK
ncbi:hypothetical protein ACTFIR_003745 [Dictyostelium discoideum]